MAKEGIQSNQEIKVGLPAREITNKINTYFEKECSKQWKNYNGARMSKYFFATFAANKSKYIYINFLRIDWAD